MIYLQPYPVGGNTIHNRVQYSEPKKNQFDQYVISPKYAIDQILNKTYKSLPGEDLNKFINRVGFNPIAV